MNLWIIVIGMNRMDTELQSIANPEKAVVLQRFFKTGKGDYGEGDVFLGITVPETRGVAKKFLQLGFSEIEQHLYSKIHEERLAALLILVEKYKKSSEKEKQKIYGFFIKHRKQVNNWDLVDLTADKIVGQYLLGKNKSILFRLAKSKNIWDKRIAIVSTFAFIKENKFEETFKISEMLLNDRQDLIHKAVGWMLREAGKRNIEAERKFLKKHYKKMPRTMLRYAIEKFPEKERQEFMK